MPMTQPMCPLCGQPMDNAAEVPTGSARSVAQELALTQSQLLAYAQDLARAYATQKHMAQYVPGELRDRITQGNAQVAGERRYVTVLFADLVNFTNLASRMDTEEVFTLMNACFRRLVSHVFKYGGVIDKFLGDGIMAIFGAPVAHEDDPERAVQAALDMEMEIQVFSREMQPYLGMPLDLHIGINCGDVIAGTVGVDEQLSYTVMGETVNLAFRLQELAEPGTILVGEAVQQQTEHLFNYRSLGEFQVKGIDGLVPVFSVQSRQETRVAGQLTGDVHLLPWAGRQSEMAVLNDLSGQLTAGTGGVVVVTGEPGLGKTRLAREWLNSLAPSAATILTRTAHMFHRRTSYSLWRGIIKNGPPGAIPTESAAPSDQAGWAIPLPDAVAQLAHNQPIPTETTGRDEDARMQTVQAMRDLLAAQAKQSPLVLVVDNWQWVDGVSRQLMLSLLPLADEHPILFCILSRTTEESSQDILRQIEGPIPRNHDQIDLAPLRQEDCEALLASLIDPDSMPSRAQSAILDWAQGNPFFLKELVLLMIAEGIVELSEDRWRVVDPERLTSLRIPPTLRGLAMANLDRLPDELQEVMNYAAVIGSVFSLRLLQAVVDRERKVSQLRDRLQELIRDGIVEETAWNNDTFAFRHTIVQESISDRLLSDRRMTLHRLVADEMEMLPDRDTVEGVGLIAYHFVEAGVPTKAIPYLIRAGQHAAGHAAHNLAAEHFLVALDVLDDAPRYETERPGLETAVANVYMQSGQHDEAIVHYQRALETTGDLEQSMDLHQLLSRAYAAQDNLADAWKQIEWALELLAEGDIPATSPTRGRVYADCAQIEWRLGKESRAELWAREAMIILEGTGDLTSLTSSCETLSRVYAGLDQHDLARYYAARATQSLAG